MGTQPKDKVQAIVVLAIVILWIVSVVLATLDGNEMLKIVTPITTMMFGWLFAVKASPS